MKTKNIIKVGYLISYDFELVFTSLEQVYPYADSIYLAIDAERKTWNGDSFNIPDLFFERIAEIDSQKKIHLYEDNFYAPELSPIECDTRERNMLLKKMGTGWLIQIDADEYIYQFKHLADFLRRHSYLLWFPKYTAVTFSGRLITLFKRYDDGYFYIDNGERYNFITNYPQYTRVRNNQYLKRFDLEIQTIHQSWARTPEEIETKINNWGHTNDLDIAKFLAFWKNINRNNYESYSDFHPLNPKRWNKLFFIEASSVNAFIQAYQMKRPQTIKRFGIRDLLSLLKFNIKNPKPAI